MRFAAFCLETGRCYLLPHELSVDRVMVQLRLEPTKNNQAAGIRGHATTSSALH